MESPANYASFFPALYGHPAHPENGRTQLARHNRRRHAFDAQSRQRNSAAPRCPAARSRVRVAAESSIRRDSFPGRSMRHLPSLLFLSGGPHDATAAGAFDLAGTRSVPGTARSMGCLATGTFHPRARTHGSTGRLAQPLHVLRRKQFSPIIKFKHSYLQKLLIL